MKSVLVFKAAITNYHKPHDLKRQKCILSQSESQKSKLKVSTDLVPSGCSKGELVACLSPSSQWPKAILSIHSSASGRITPASASIFTGYHPCVSSHFLSFIRTPIIKFRATLIQDDHISRSFNLYVQIFYFHIRSCPQVSGVRIWPSLYDHYTTH